MPYHIPTKLHNFPVPYPNELLYSVFARYHIYSRNNGFTQTYYYLFNQKPVMSYDLPYLLDMIVSKLNPLTLITSDLWIQDHTLLPLYSPYLPKNRLDRAVKGMKNYKSFTSKQVRATHELQPSFFRYCLKCVQEDEEKYGEAYWHREHQIYGVEVCAVHECWLMETDIGISHKAHPYKFVDITSGLTSGKVMSDSKEQYFPYYIWIAKAVFWLLQFDLYEIELSEVQRRYKMILKEKNLMSGKLIRMVQLETEFINFYGKELLQKLSCDIVSEEDHWLKKLLNQRNNIRPPLHHLLLTMFLGVNMEQLFGNEIEEQSPFGHRPWLCLNRAANHYMEPVIDNITYPTKIRKKPIGEFHCSCGFVYRRFGPDKSVEDKRRYNRVVSFGQVWEQELRRLTSDDKLPSGEVAQRLGVSPASIWRYLKRQKQNGDLDATSLKSEKEFARKLDKRRTAWLLLRKVHPDFSRSQCAKSDTGTYTWLRENDREWLMENSAPLKSKKRGGTSSPEYWFELDQEVHEKIPIIVEEIMKEDGRPVRISIALLSYRLGVSSLWRNLYRLPKTKATVELVCETVEQIQIRRVKWAVAEILTKGLSPTKREIRKYTISGKLSKDTIDTIIAELV